MASVTQKGTHRSMTGTELPTRDEDRRPRSTRRWKILAGAALLLGVVVWLAPMLIAKSPMMGWIVSSAAADLDGSVDVGSASLGWFSPVGLSNIEVRDKDGQLVMAIPQVKGDRSLLALAFNRQRLGTFRLEKPQLSVVLDDKGTNIERLIAKYLEPSEGPSPAVAIVIVDGTVTVEDRTGVENAGDKNTAGDSWKIENLEIDFAMPEGRADPMTLTASGNIPDGRQAGKFDIELTMPGAEPGGSGAEDNRLAVKTSSLPLEKLAKLIARFASGTEAADLELAGRLDAKIDCRWPLAGFSQGMALNVDTSVADLRLSTPHLNGDRVVLDNLAAVGDINWRRGRLMVERASLDCDLGRLALLGRIELDSSAVATSSDADTSSDGTASLGALAPYAKQTFQLDGNLDIARLAAMLPNTLHIHKQTKVTSGNLTVALASQKGKDGMVWTGRIATSDLTAMRRGRELVWQQPIVVTLNAHESKVGPVIDELKCSSTFLNAQAAGWRGDLEASLNFDLDRLAGRLDAYVDLSGVRMSGKGWVNLDWQRDKQNAFKLDADLQITGLMLSMGGRRPWSEDSITATINATGRTDFRRDYRLDTAELEARIGGEELRAALTKPVPQIRADAVWPLEISAQGQLAGWVERAKSWVAVDDVQLAGAYRLHAKGTGSRAGVAVDECEFNVADLRLVGHGLNVAEPRAKLALAGQYSAAECRMLIKTVDLDCPTLRARGDSLILGMPPGKPLELAGDFSYQGDLTGLQRWIADPTQPQTWRVGGRLVGQGRLKQVSDITSGRMEATIENLVAVNTAGQQFVEPKLQIVAGGVYENAKRMLTFDQLTLSSQAVAANLAGKITAADPSNSATAANAVIDGQINYDMEKLTGLLRPYLGNGVFIAGAGSRPISFRGPLSLAKGRAQAGLDWQQAYVYGFRVGTGEMKLSLQDGTVRLAPISLPVSQGRVNLDAQLTLAPGPMELHVAPGPLVQQVRIDPDMCAYGLQYLAPVLAGVTSAQGQFSIDIDECRIPLDNPSVGKLAGRFTVHSVEIGPGPLIRELAAVLLPGAAAARLTRESVIDFQLANGRVYHSGLELQFPDLTIRTRGSVGLDKTLSMVAEMPVPPMWTRDPRVAAAVAGQTISLPIGGTLDRPQIDRRKLDEYTREFTRRAAGNLIEQEVGNQLNRLFGPRK